LNPTPSSSSPETADLPNEVRLTRALTARDGFMIVAGSVIGSGIFLVPGPIAKQLPSLFAVMVVWLFGGLLSIFGALSLAEMGAMFPGAGGLYIYLRRAYGRSVAFLYGWGLLGMIQTGSIATLGAGFGLYLSYVIGLSPVQEKIVASGIVLLITAINLLGLSAAKHLQNISAVAKFGGIALLGILLFTRGHASNLASSWTASTSTSTVFQFGVALIAVLWSFEGWHVVSFTAAEFKNPGRDLPRSLISGTLVVGAIYIILNIAYYSVLGVHGVSGVDSAAAASMTAAYGAGATRFVSILILVSMAGAMNGLILTGPRVYYAMACDGDFLPVLGRLSPKSRVPTVAIVVQGVWAAILILLGSFQQLFTDVVFTAWIFYGLAVAAVIILRKKFPDAPRPFRTPGYPFVPILFVLAAGLVAVSTIVTMPKNALAGIGLILTGIPVYLVFAFRRRSRTQSPAI
jgi:APA family basic amino acid/polyamine antiporter